MEKKSVVKNFSARALKKAVPVSGIALSLILGAPAAFAAGSSSQGNPAGDSASQTLVTAEVAYAVPRVDPIGSSGLALPEPLLPAQAAQVREVLSLYAEGNVAAGEALAQKINSSVLQGYLEAARLLSPGFTPSPAALVNWLSENADSPEAGKVYAKLQQVDPTVAAQIPAPVLPELPDVGDAGLAMVYQAGNSGLAVNVRDLARQGLTQQALNLISQTSMTAIEGASLRAEVAQILFTHNQNAQAVAVASYANREAGQQIELAPFVLGLVYWQEKDYGKAFNWFQKASAAPFASPNQAAAAAFWAARAALRSYHPAYYVRYLTKAAAAGGGFYTILAERLLGTWQEQDPAQGSSLSSQSGSSQSGPVFGINPAPSVPTLSEAGMALLARMPEAQKAFALLEIGQKAEAEAELQVLASKIYNQPVAARSLALLATYLNMSGLVERLSPYVVGGDNLTAEPPVELMQPDQGFKIDPALVFAVTRVESDFNPAAVSPVGARGLMQLMPQTAAFLLGSQYGVYSAVSNASSNLELGQKYLNYLADQSWIRGNLIKILASYNIGPGAFEQIQTDAAQKQDPILFIEEIPNQQTRTFVKRVLAYQWIYASELGLPAPSLSELAGNRYPSLMPYKIALPLPPAKPALLQTANGATIPLQGNLPLPPALDLPLPPTISLVGDSQAEVPLPPTFGLPLPPGPQTARSSFLVQTGMPLPPPSPGLSSRLS